VAGTSESATDERGHKLALLPPRQKAAAETPQPPIGDAAHDMHEHPDHDPDRRADQHGVKRSV